jgi:hypothetical protein
MMPNDLRVDETTKFLYIGDKLARIIRRWKRSNLAVIMGMSALWTNGKEFAGS